MTPSEQGPVERVLRLALALMSTDVIRHRGNALTIASVRSGIPSSAAKEAALLIQQTGWNRTHPHGKDDYLRHFGQAADDAHAKGL